MVTAAGTVSPSATPRAKPAASASSPSPSTEKPNNFGSWPIRMVSASPFMYPSMVGRESRSAMNPSFATPATVIISPTISASMEASATALAGSPPAPNEATITAAIIGPSEESGPRTRIREGPNTA